jgi:hypothetical protein
MITDPFARLDEIASKPYGVTLRGLADPSLPARPGYGVSVDTLRRRVVTGDLPASRLGRRLIGVRVEDLDHMFRPIPTVHPAWRRGA